MKENHATAAAILTRTMIANLPNIETKMETPEKAIAFITPYYQAALNFVTKTHEHNRTATA
jgi:hypothetical protein